MPNASRASSTDNGNGNGSNGDPNGDFQTLKQDVPAKSYSRTWWKFKMRDDDNEEDVEWWFASTAIPLIAATIAPLANVLSIAALVTYWRMDTIIDGEQVPQLQGNPFPDPRWVYWLNVASLILGFVGNLFLLFNFTRRVRYLVALPVTIVVWYIATGILIAITISMNVYYPPDRAIGQTYTQGFWYAIFAACLYCICSMLLMVNMLGYFLGHYPQHFTLTVHQRTLILQTMLFFIWLAAGGAVFSHVETHYAGEGNEWSFVDGLYFCDVTILTVGFGDLVPNDDLGRGLVFPYSVGGIIMLGLVISSTSKFAAEIGADNIVKKHLDHSRTRTIERTTTSSMDMQRPQLRDQNGRKKSVRFSSPNDEAVNGQMRLRGSWVSSPQVRMSLARRSSSIGRAIPPVRKRLAIRERVRGRKSKLILLREEKDRFNAMRRIQDSTDSFKRWWRLTLSIIAFGILWCVGAVVFWQCEKDVQGMTYFQALYLCYVSLLTIGYGDLAPKSNAGRPFFVVWSLIAVPTMTILIGDMGDTVISGFKQGTFIAADFTILPKAGVWRALVDKAPWLKNWLRQIEQRRRAKRGIPGPDDEGPPQEADIEELAAEAEEDEESGPPSFTRLAQDLAAAIERTAHDLTLEKPGRYSYEEWVELTRLIRFTSGEGMNTMDGEEEEDLVDWDWIGENSPMMSGQSEPEFVLDRLCESMRRYIKSVERQGGWSRDTAKSAGTNVYDPGTGTEAAQDGGGSSDLEKRDREKDSSESETFNKGYSS